MIPVLVQLALYFFRLESYSPLQTHPQSIRFESLLRNRDGYFDGLTYALNLVSVFALAFCYNAIPSRLQRTTPGRTIKSQPGRSMAQCMPLSYFHRLSVPLSIVQSAIHSRPA